MYIYLGYYEGGNFGIRIETVCITKSHTFLITEQPPSKPFCSLETVTLVPIQTSLIDRHLLDESELLWLNEYHSRIRRELTPIMKRLFPEAMDFLLQSTELI